MSDFPPEHRAGDEEPVVGDAPPNAKTLFSNKAYDRLKWVAIVLLPALALFYLAIAPLWGLPKQEEVAGTVVALDLLLGTLLGLSTKKYNNSDARFDGNVVLTGAEDGNTNVNFQVETASVAEKNEVVLKVVDRQQ